MAKSHEFYVTIKTDTPRPVVIAALNMLLAGLAAQPDMQVTVTPVLEGCESGDENPAN